MTNTYKDSDSMEVKQLEELRCLRCVLERILRVMDEGLFIDYQMEKFGSAYKSNLETENKMLKLACEGYKHDIRYARRKLRED